MFLLFDWCLFVVFCVGFLFVGVYICFGCWFGWLCDPYSTNHAGSRGYGVSVPIPLARDFPIPVIFAVCIICCISSSSFCVHS